MEKIYFYLGISFILMHEMDAIRCKEWRIFPGLSLLDDKMGQTIFIFAHVPLFFIIFYFLENMAFQKGLDIFLIIHCFLHILFLKHQKNEFKDWISWSIIILASIFGGLDLFFRFI